MAQRRVHARFDIRRGGDVAYPPQGMHLGQTVVGRITKSTLLVMFITNYVVGGKGSFASSGHTCKADDYETF